MTHPSLIAWEKKLKAVLDKLDHELEDKYGDRYPLHPARPGRGSTANPAHDGLFDITANFTLGSGSDIGRGYVVDIHMPTLTDIPRKICSEIENHAVHQLRKLLPHHFPGKNLRVDLDGDVIKIHGDLSLGDV